MVVQTAVCEYFSDALINFVSTATLRLEDHLPKQRLYVAENASLTLSCPIEVGNITKKNNDAIFKWILGCEECTFGKNIKFTALKPRVLNLPDENVAQWTYICQVLLTGSPKWEWSLIVYSKSV